MRTLRFLLAVAVSTSAVAVTPSIASPQDPSRTPQGYTFCGWSNFDGSWTMTGPEPGAYRVAFADGMTCRSARRNVNRVRYSKNPPYRPLRTGYRCRTLASQHEYADVRCVKVGGTQKFRFRTGA
ncbi:MAG TPA: hypothetical protein VGV40_08335 [Solirubrobacteraceae bacterium]|nr:hypothetical protein [Solirubrobacteraceae bacterium]